MFVPNSTDPGVAGNGVGSDFNTAQQLALSGLANLCSQAGYFGVEPGVH